MNNPFKSLDKGNGYEAPLWYTYYSVKTDQSGTIARFKKNIFTRRTYVFMANCSPTNNCWNETGYGWGIWRKV